jgi:hypothetical protein
MNKVYSIIFCLFIFCSSYGTTPEVRSLFNKKKEYGLALGLHGGNAFYFGLDYYVLKKKTLHSTFSVYGVEMNKDFTVFAPKFGQEYKFLSRFLVEADVLIYTNFNQILPAGRLQTGVIFRKFLHVKVGKNFFYDNENILVKNVNVWEASAAIYIKIGSYR